MNQNKGNHKHLTLSDRIYIEQALWDNKPFYAIARELDKSPTTISKEIRRFLAWDNGKDALLPGNDCAHFHSCKISELCVHECGALCKNCPSGERCNQLCRSYTPTECLNLKKAPYVCNGCRCLDNCTFTRYYYSAQKAEKRYRGLLGSSRTGIHLSPEQLEALNNLVSPLVKKGQPISHIYSTHYKEIPVSRKTLYNYIDGSLLDIRNIDLPRRVRYKIRKQQRKANPVQYAYKTKRTYVDFVKYTSAFPDYEVVEMDTVKGTNEAGKCLLTLLFRNSSFMLIFLLPSCTQKSVQAVFDRLYADLGPRIFKKTFRIILTDNGPEFKDPWSIESAPDGSKRTKVFYCDPYTSNQKSRLEKNHEYIRYIIPKGRSMYFLTEEHVRIMTCHINSVGRDSLNESCPFDLASLLINKKVLRLLGLHKISPDNVILKPALVK